MEPIRTTSKMKNKREVILEFNSSPDAILNALHQAGWQVIPKKDPDQSVWDYLDGKPQRSEQQEWTPQEILSWLRKGKPELVAEIERLNAALSAERQRREGDAQALDGLGKLNDELHQQLLSAQATIEAHNNDPEMVEKCGRFTCDLSALHQHDAEVRKPFATANLRLVEALTTASGTLSKIRNAQGNTLNPYELSREAYETQRTIDDALAKAKEGK